MFLRSKGGYTRDGEQWTKGPFLMIFSLTPGKELRACVRTVSLHQLGHWMMGHTIVEPHKISLSGCYGDDGWPIDPNKFPGLWDRLIPLPPELTEAFWKGGGHNSCGNEGPAVQDWATVNEKALRIAGKA